MGSDIYRNLFLCSYNSIIATLTSITHIYTPCKITSFKKNFFEILLKENEEHVYSYTNKNMEV